MGAGSSKSLNISYITDKSYPFYYGGYETRVFEFARRLSLYHDIRVYTSLPVKTYQYHGVNFRKVSTASFQRSKTSRSLIHSALFGLSLIREPFGIDRPDIVIIESIPYIHLSTVKKWADKINSVIIVDLAEVWIQYGAEKLVGRVRNRIIKQFLQSSMNYADFYLTSSNVTAISLEKNYHVPKCKIRVVPPAGVDVNVINAIEVDPESKHIYDFVSMGRLVNIKRFDDFITALHIIKKRGWNGKAAIIGDGPNLYQLQKKANSLNLNNNLDFLGFVLDDITKIQILKNSRIFVLCSEREGFSIATLEAIACGLPAIVAKPKTYEVFGVSDFVKNGVDGLYFQIGNVEELANKMIYLLENPEIVGNFGKSSLQISKKYDSNLIVEDFVNFLRGLSK